MIRGGATSFFEQDGLGSVTSLANSSGAITDTYTFNSYGNLTASGGTTNPFRYTGREYDQETGLYYYRARYYDPAAGRFLSEDSLGFFGGRNFYAYTWNNPVNFVDPRGTFPLPPFVGPLPPIQAPGQTTTPVQTPFTVNLDDPEIKDIAHYPWPPATNYYGESHQCVSLTKHFGKLPCTDCWRAGPRVIGSDIARGTPIATFDDNGRYPQDDVPKNSGIYAGNNYRNMPPKSFAIIDQWPGHLPQGRVVRPEPHGSVSDDSGSYSVITVPYGTKSKKCKCGNW